LKFFKAQIRKRIFENLRLRLHTRQVASGFAEGTPHPHRPSVLGLVKNMKIETKHIFPAFGAFDMIVPFDNSTYHAHEQELICTSGLNPPLLLPHGPFLLLSFLSRPSSRDQFPKLLTSNLG
jgi:hypothetical protein